MRYKKFFLLILAAPLAALALANEARHSAQDSQDQTTQDQHRPAMPSGGPMGPGMMRSGQDMMGASMMTSRLMAHYEGMCETMDKLMASMTTIENEKNPAVLKSKLAEHRALLEQMRDQVVQQSMMYEMGRAPRIPLTPRVWK